PACPGRLPCLALVGRTATVKRRLRAVLVPGDGVSGGGSGDGRGHPLLRRRCPEQRNDQPGLRFYLRPAAHHHYHTRLAPPPTHLRSVCGRAAPVYPAAHVRTQAPLLFLALHAGLLPHLYAVRNGGETAVDQPPYSLSVAGPLPLLQQPVFHLG